MYKFLTANHNQLLSQIDPKKGFIELDFSNDDHYRFFVSRVGGLKAFNTKHPNLIHTLQELRKTPLVPTEQKIIDGYVEGSEDNMAIENLLFYSSSEETDGTTMATIMADYKDMKESIVVISELYDVDKEMLLLSSAEEVSNTTQFRGEIQADYHDYIEDKQREFMISSLFYCTRSQTLGSELKAYVAKTAGFTLPGTNDVIKSFTLNDPVIQEANRKDPNHTKVKISYNRDGSIPDYDYTNHEDPFADKEHTKIIVRVPFSVTIEAGKGFFIKGYDKHTGYRMWLINVMNGTINHYCNDDDIIQRKDAFDDQNRCTKMTIIFPTWWRNVLDFTQIGYKVNTDVDFYSSFGLTMYSEQLNDIKVNVSVKSNGAKYDLLNIQCSKIFIQWGCIARDTEIVMADGSIKRADQIEIGDFVQDADGRAVQVKKILSGYEERLYKISTPNRSVRVTPDHIVCTEEGLLPAIDLHFGMWLKTISGLEPIVAIGWEDYKDTVYNFEFDHKTIMIGNGLMIGDAMLQNNVKGLVAYEA